MSLILDDVTEVCVICVQYVLNNEEGILCEGKCERWFHRTCAKISTNDYKKLAKNSKILWFCNRVDCKASAKCPEFNQMAQLLDKVTILANKVEDYKTTLDLVLDNVTCIKRDVFTLTNTVHKLDERVVVNETKIARLESRLSREESRQEFIFEELNNRLLRAKNVIIFKVPESTSNYLFEKIEYDKNIVIGILNETGVAGNKFIRVSRLGKQVSGISRPLKVVLESSDIASTVLQNRHKIKNDYIVRPDQTLKQREYYFEIKAELEDRTKKGESNLTIRYINGCPKILKKSNYFATF